MKTNSAMSPVPPQPTAANERFRGVGRLDEIAQGKTPLGRGSRGEGVERLQQALVDMGYANSELIAAGRFDADTERATRRFQRDVDVVDDGVVGEKTLSLLAELAPPPGHILETSPEYERLYADGRLDFTIAIGFDEKQDVHDWWEQYIVFGLEERGFRAASSEQILNMTAEDRTRLGLEGERYDPSARYYLREAESEGEPAVVVRLITQGTGGAAARASFEQALQQDELLIYAGHARYGTGPDFDHMTESGAGNFVIDGHGNRAHARAPTGLTATIGAATRSDLRELTSHPDYQLLIFNGCSSEEYLRNLRNPKIFQRDADNTDVITTTMPMRARTVPAHTLGFLDGILQKDSTHSILAAENQREVDQLTAGGKPAEARKAKAAYFASGFLRNTNTRFKASSER